MKKIITFIIIITIFAKCQKDDICIETVTPKLVIGFYDKDNPDEYKMAKDLIVWADGMDPLDEYNDVSVDSIVIPLDLAQNFTKYYLQSEEIDEEIQFEYTRKEIYVSRSCGYKYNFEGLNFIINQFNWIQNIEITNDTITDETQHIKILH